MKPGVVAALAALATFQAGCHTMRFEVAPEDHARVVYERKSFWFWGLTPTAKVDVSERCPAGVAAVRDELTFVDGLFGNLTLGIWTPRSSWFYCLPEDAAGESERSTS